MTDRPYGDDADDDVFTGEYLDALFEVETSGEALPLDMGADAPEPVVVDDAEFSLGRQLGEDLPPELQDEVAGDGDEALELDPTDPGFTAADLEDLGLDEFDEYPEHEYREPAEEPAAHLPEEEAPATEMHGDSVPTSDWLLGLGDPQPAGDDAAAEGGIPAGYEYLFREGSEDDDDEPVPARAAPDRGSVPADDVSVDLPPEGSAPADFELPDWAALSDDTVTSTTEYADLAAEVALSAGIVAEPSAVSANMPGIDTGLVGMEDVVGETAPAPAPTTHPDLAMRVLTGLGLITLFALSLLWPVVLGALATIVFVAAAGELYAVLRANGLHPIPFIGLAGVLGALAGTWVWGLGAVPVALLLTLVVLALQMAMTGQRQEPLQDASLTMLGAVWIGGLGAFAFPLITAADYRWLIVAVVTIVAGLDVGQYFIGRRMGKRPLAPVVSPKKTVEGLLGGAAVAVVVAVLLWVASPLPLIPLVVLALASVVLGPLGDLSVSVVKRILAVKDMGTILPGHGGILDRIDGLLFVLPAAWLVFEVAGLIT